MNANELIEFYNDFREQFIKDFVFNGLDHNINEAIDHVFDEFEKRTKIYDYYKKKDE